ncbi:hypothetical protein, partial [Nocardia sp. NPDC057455]|uniref:hypothetical protein n=1 Tax=Nocardia sp. NPDC057455 TaxID=3346138 RepID=UPI00366BE63E
MSLVSQLTALTEAVGAQVKKMWRGEPYTGNLDAAPMGWSAVATASASNHPGLGDGVALTMRNSDDTVRAQMFYAYAGTYAVRYRSGGTWGAWSPFYSGHEAWSDITSKPTSFTPAAHSHAISEITSLTAVLDDKAGLSPLRTVVLPFSNGGLGGTVAGSLASATAGSDRFVFKPFEDVEQWWWNIRHRDYAQTAKTAATLTKVIAGTHSRSNTAPAAETGSFVGNAATTVVATSQTIPGDGTWYTSPAITSALFTGMTEYLIGFGWTISPSTAVQLGAGRSWHWTNATSGVDPTVAGSGATQTYLPFDWRLDCQYTTRRRITLVIGDSIGEGIQGSNTALAPTTLARNAFNIWAAR